MSCTVRVVMFDSKNYSSSDQKCQTDNCSNGTLFDESAEVFLDVDGSVVAVKVDSVVEELVEDTWCPDQTAKEDN